MNTLALVIEERDQARAEVAYLRDIIKARTDPMFACPGELAHFSNIERRVLCALKKADGALVHRETMVGLLYFDRANPPDERSVDVIIRKIRGKLQSHRICTFWKEGWRLVEIQNEVPV